MASGDVLGELETDGSKAVGNCGGEHEGVAKAGKAGAILRDVEAVRGHASVDKGG